MRRKIFTWHVHGSYLYYLSHIPHDIYVPVREEKGDSYHGRTKSYAWPDNVIEIPAEEVKNARFDMVLFQHRNNYENHQYDILSPAQRELPKVYIEHDPPQEHPTDTRHWVDDPGVLLVHVTDFNRLFWDCGRTPTRVVDHGVVCPPGAAYTGVRERGIVVVNNLAARGRRLGHDVFEEVRAEVPLDLYGMGYGDAGGVGEAPHDRLFGLAGEYRFFFNPIRYTSLGLAVLEAMSVGVPVVGLATTELVTVIRNGVNGFVSTNVAALVDCMKRLLADPAEAASLGREARKTIEERFSLGRFVRDWDAVVREVTGDR